MNQPPLTFVCPATKQSFTTRQYTCERLSPEYHMVWTHCPYCDVHGNTRGSVGYDPKRPQPHGYLVEDDDAASDTA